MFLHCGPKACLELYRIIIFVLCISFIFTVESWVKNTQANYISHYNSLILMLTMNWEDNRS